MFLPRPRYAVELKPQLQIAPCNGSIVNRLLIDGAGSSTGLSTLIAWYCYSRQAYRDDENPGLEHYSLRLMNRSPRNSNHGLQSVSDQIRVASTHIERLKLASSGSFEPPKPRTTFLDCLDFIGAAGGI
jgi:hypothetical protein